MLDLTSGARSLTPRFAASGSHRWRCFAWRTAQHRPRPSGSGANGTEWETWRHALGLTRRGRALAVAAVLAVLVPEVAAAAPTRVARVAADDDGLAVTTKVTYRYDPAVPAVLVDTDLTITNEIPPVTRGNVIESQYFTGYGLGVPADAADLRAVTSDGRSLCGAEGGGRVQGRRGRGDRLRPQPLPPGHRVAAVQLRAPGQHAPRREPEPGQRGLRVVPDLHRGRRRPQRGRAPGAVGVRGRHRRLADGPERAGRRRRLLGAGGRPGVVLRRRDRPRRHRPDHRGGRPRSGHGPRAGVARRRASGPSS